MSAKPKPAKAKRSFRQIASETIRPYRQLAPFLKPYRWRFILGLLCGAVAAGINGCYALVMKHVMEFVTSGNAANETRTIDSVLWICALIPAMVVARSFFGYLNSILMAWVSLRLLVDIRTKLFRHILRQSLDFFAKTRSGWLLARVNNDSRMAQQALMTVSSDIVMQPFAIVGAVVALCILDWRFTIGSLALFPLCLVPIIIFGRKVRQAGSAEENEAGAMMVIMQEAFAGIRVIKSLCREEDEMKDFEESSATQFQSAIKVRKAMEIVSPLIESVAAMGVGLALFYVWYYQVSAATFIGLLTGLFVLYDPVKKLSRVSAQMQRCFASTTRIFELLALEPSVRDVPDAKMLAKVRGDILVEGLWFQYPTGESVLRGLDLKMEAGKTYALVGASGAGKSTLLSLLLRFYDPTYGRIYIDGQNISAVNTESLRAQMSIVTQETFLFHTSIAENIRYGRFDATDAEVREAARQAYAHDFIMQQPKGYETVIGDKGCMLSGGQQQRVSIARALLKNAPILLLDEATSALDSEAEGEVQRAIDALAEGRTVIAIAHRLSTILNADQIVVMHRGEIKDTGTHAELYEKSTYYRRLYDLQFKRHHGEEVPVAELAEVL